MAPNLRPTLSTRIRASFDGKGTKSSVHNSQEAKTFIVQDAAVLRDAIGQAINNDTFQNAIAAHLAELIKPSIKEALDTIQPVVETVYQHDILLRKTNRSVEDLLQRFDSAAEKGDDGHGPDSEAVAPKDAIGAEEIKQLLKEHKTHNNVRFSELSSSVHAGHNKISQAVIDIADIKIAQSVSSQSLASLRTTAQQSTTDNFKLQEQLDELKNELRNVMKSMETQSGTLIRIKEADLATAEILGAIQEAHTSHTVALSEIKAQDQSFKSASVPIFEKTHADTATAFQTLTANLAALKDNIRIGFASENDIILRLRSKIDGVLSSVDTINSKDSSREILTSVQKSNDFHAHHATVLESIKGKLATAKSEKAIAAEQNHLPTLTNHLNTIAATLDSHTSSLSALQRRADPEFRLNNIATTLDSHAAQLSAMRDDHKSDDILTALRTSNEAHITHGKDLDEIKTVAKAIDESHVSHTADLGEIKALTNAAGAQLAAHTSDLGNIKAAVAEAGNSHTSHAKDLGDVKSAIATANNSHASDTTALEMIKATNDNNAQGISSQSRSLEALETQMGTVIATLGSQNIVHSDIRDAVHASNEAHTSHSTDLGEIKNSVRTANDSLVSHASTLEAIKVMNDSAAETTAAQNKSLASLESELGTMSTNIQAQGAVHSEIRDAVHSSYATHTTALDYILSAHGNTSEQLNAQATALDAVGVQLGSISMGLDQQAATHSEIKDAINVSNISHVSHAAALSKAETTHKDVLENISGSRDLLAGHSEALSAQTTMLENAREVHAKSQRDVIDHISTLKQDVGVHGSTLKELQAETRGSHLHIKDSVVALGDGVHLNEKGVGQLAAHTAPGLHVVEPISNNGVEAASEAVLSHPSHPLMNEKSALGLGMAAVVGGGLVAVAGTEELFGHGEYDANEAHGRMPIDNKPVDKVPPYDVEEPVAGGAANYGVEEPIVEATPDYEDKEPFVAEAPSEVLDEPVPAETPHEAVNEPVAEEAPHEATEEPVTEEVPYHGVVEPVTEDAPREATEELVNEEAPYRRVVEPVAEDLVGRGFSISSGLAEGKEIEQTKPIQAEQPAHEVEPTELAKPSVDELVIVEEPSAVGELLSAELLVHDEPSHGDEFAGAAKPDSETAQAHHVDSSIAQYFSRKELADEVPADVDPTEPTSTEVKDAEHLAPASKGDFVTEPVQLHKVEPVPEEPLPDEPSKEEAVRESKPSQDELVREEPPSGGQTAKDTTGDELLKERISEPLVDDNIRELPAEDPPIRDLAIPEEQSLDKPTRDVEPVEVLDSATEPFHQTESSPVVDHVHENELATQESVPEVESLRENDSLVESPVRESEAAHETQSTLDEPIVEKSAIEESLPQTGSSYEQPTHEAPMDKEHSREEPEQVAKDGHEEVESGVGEPRGEDSINTSVPVIEAATHTNPGATSEPATEIETMPGVESIHEVEQAKTEPGLKSPDLESEPIIKGIVTESGREAVTDSAAETPRAETEQLHDTRAAHITLPVGVSDFEQPAVNLVSSSQYPLIDEPDMEKIEVKDTPIETKQEEIASAGEVEPNAEEAHDGNELPRDIPIENIAQSAAVDGVHEVVSLHDDGEITEEPSADIEPVHKAGSALVEPELTEPFTDTISVGDPTSTYRDILHELTAVRPAEGPSFDENSPIIVKEEVKPRPVLTKRVSFKEPLTEVKLAPEVDPGAEMAPVEESAEEPRPLEVEPRTEEAAAEDLSKDRELNMSGPDVDPVKECPLVDEQPIRTLPVEDERLVDSEPSEQTSQSTDLDEQGQESEQRLEAEPFTGPELTGPDRSLEKEPGVEQLSRDLGTKIHAQVDPTLERERADESASEPKPVRETSLATKGESQDEIIPAVEEPAVEEPAIGAESSKELESTLESSRREDRVAHGTAAQEMHNEKTGAGTAHDEQPTETLPAHNSVAEEPAMREVVVHSNMDDRSATHDIKHDDSVDPVATEVLASEESVPEPGSASKGLPVKEPPPHESSTEDPAPVISGEPVMEEPIIHSAAEHDPIVEKRATNKPILDEPILETLVEKGTSAVDETSAEEPVVRPEAIIPESAIDEPTVHELLARDAISSEPAGTNIASRESATHGSVPGDVLVVPGRVEQPRVEFPITEPLEESEAAVEQAQVSLTEKPPIVEDSLLPTKSQKEEVLSSNELDGRLKVESAEKKSAIEAPVEEPTGEDLTTKAESAKEDMDAEIEEEAPAETEADKEKAGQGVKHAYESVADLEPATEKAATEPEPEPKSEVEVSNDFKPDTTAQPGMKDQSPAIEIRPEAGVHSTELAAEIEPFDEDPNDEPVDEEPTVHDPIDQTDESLVHDSNMPEQLEDYLTIDDQAAEEAVLERQIEHPTTSLPSKTMPTRVDSGVEVDSPTEIKSVLTVAPLQTVTEDPAFQENTAEESTHIVASPRSTVHESTTEEPATEAKQQVGKPPVHEYGVEAGPASEAGTEEFHSAISEQTETADDHFFDAEDDPVTKSTPVTTAEPVHENSLSKLKHAMESLFHQTPAHHDSVEDTPITGEPATATHAVKDLHVDVKPDTKERHTRVDSGIDVETPTKEPLGTLEPVVEARPAEKVAAELESEAA